jgi:hypothetical protein
VPTARRRARQALFEGVVKCRLVALSFLALLALRYPARTLPVLLLEVPGKAL